MQLQAPPKRKLESVPAADVKPLRTDDDSAPIRCATCDHVITHAAARREVDGRHVHLRLNPSAYAFIFGCFSTAPGCLINGEPTDAATWFSGCRWQFAHCARCQTHLGWAFTGGDTFFALLLERLVDETS